jgi:hypothetical protein
MSPLLSTIFQVYLLIWLFPSIFTPLLPITVFTSPIHSQLTSYLYLRPTYSNHHSPSLVYLAITIASPSLLIVPKSFSSRHPVKINFKTLSTFA